MAGAGACYLSGDGQEVPNNADTGSAGGQMTLHTFMFPT